MSMSGTFGTFTDLYKAHINTSNLKPTFLRSMKIPALQNELLSVNKNNQRDQNQL